MTKVWITRTQPSADKTAKAVRALGFQAIISPLLSVAPPDTSPPMPDKDAVLVFTSGNGIRAFCDLTDMRSWPVITVGDATADIAKEYGFETVTSASGDSNDVVHLILNAIPKTQPVIHCAGRVVRGSITEDLQTKGYKARRDIYYQTVPSTNLPDIDNIDIVLLHSPLAAQLLSHTNLDLSQAMAISLSDAIDAELTLPLLGERRTANSPNEAALLACLPQ